MLKKIMKGIPALILCAMMLTTCGPLEGDIEAPVAVQPGPPGPPGAEAVVSSLSLNSSITAPAAGYAQNTTPINDTQYTGSVIWNEDDGATGAPAIFAPATVYKAIVTLSAKSGYTFSGLSANIFSYTGASVSHLAGSSTTLELTITFPATASVVTHLDLSGKVTAPVKGSLPVITAINDDQYTGTIAWQDNSGNPVGGSFLSSTSYRAIVTLSAKSGYTFTSLAANSFTYSSALTIQNAAGSGTVTIFFNPTAAEGGDTIINALSLDSHVTAPVAGDAPVTTSVSHTQYTGSIEWKLSDGITAAPSAFAPSTIYKAVVSLSAKSGYTFTGVGLNSFVYTGATVTNPAGSGTALTVTITFPATAAAVNDLNLSSRVTAPIAGNAPNTTTINESQYTGTIAWKLSDGVTNASGPFAPSTIYKAIVTLTSKTGRTFYSIAAGSAFTHSGASAVNNTAGTGGISSTITVTVTFPATAAAVSDLDLSGKVTAPATDAAQVTTAIDNAQYAGTIAWKLADGITAAPAAFAPNTVYKAIVTLTSKTGSTFYSIAAGTTAFTHTGAATVSNTAGTDGTNSTITVTITFPATAAWTVTHLDLSGKVTAPVRDNAPVTTAVDDDQYTGTIAWQDSSENPVSGNFLPSTSYRAVVTLSAKSGYTLSGLAANCFTYSGALTVVNAANSGTVTIFFNPTAAPSANTIINALSLDSHVTAPETGEAPATTSINHIQYTGSVVWKKSDDTAAPAAFAPSTVYKAVVSLSAQPTFTFNGIGANSFSYTGAAVAHLAGTSTTLEVTITFPATAAVVSDLNLSGKVIAPVTGNAQNTTAINESQYTGTITWKLNNGTTDAPAAFAPNTVYKAIVTLNANTNFTFTGVGADSFSYTYTGASVSNPLGSGAALTVTITFPATAAVVSNLSLSGKLTAPAADAAQNTAPIDDTQYTGTIAWKQSDGVTNAPAVFAPGTEYKAVVSLSAKSGYTFTGVGLNSFVYTGATVSHPAGSGAALEVTITFPATAATVSNLSLSGKVTAPAAGYAQNTTMINDAQYTGTIVWKENDGAINAPAYFVPYTVYKAIVTLSAKTNFTFTGVGADSFNYTGALVSHLAGSGTTLTVTITFSATASNVSGVTVIPSTATVAKGGIKTFTATVTGTGSFAQTVSWTIDGTHHAGTTIVGGVLDVDFAETQTSLTVRATSTVDTSKSGTAAVAVFTVGEQISVTLSGGVPPFKLRYVPATPAGGFQRDDTSTNISTISNGYWMGETEVTQELFEAVMGTNPSAFTTDVAADETQAKRPVEQVNWYAAIAFCNKLSLKDGKAPVYSVEGITDWAALAYNSIPTSNNAAWSAAAINAEADGYRLPTEMEWMWAAMGATAGGETVQSAGYAKEFAGSTGSNAIGDYAWYSVNSSSKTHEVGKKLPNELGLVDMSGNVYEWCWDWNASSYGTGEKNDYAGAASGASRVRRSGSCLHAAANCTVTHRGSSNPYYLSNIYGFRVVCP